MQGKCHNYLLYYIVLYCCTVLLWSLSGHFDIGHITDMGFILIIYIFKLKLN